MRKFLIHLLGGITLQEMKAQKWAAISAREQMLQQRVADIRRRLSASYNEGRLFDEGEVNFILSGVE